MPHQLPASRKEHPSQHVGIDRALPCIDGGDVFFYTRVDMAYVQPRATKTSEVCFDARTGTTGRPDAIAR